MSVNVLDAISDELLTGGGMADKTLWADAANQVWRRDSLSGHYQRLTNDDTWVNGVPGTLRKLVSTPEPGDGVTTVVGRADTNTYFIKGDPGDKGDPGRDADFMAISNEVPSGVRDGTNTTFITSSPYRTSTLVVYRNGLREQRGVGYIEAGPAVITITTAPDALDVITVDYVMA